MSSPFKHPELMVIGDSPPQGCHSLSVTAEFCAHSYPAQAARVLSWNFDVPTFPRPVIFNLEEIVRDDLFPFPATLLPLLLKLENNLKFWRSYFSAPPLDSPEYFDNLAVTAATLGDIESLSYSRSQITLNENSQFSFLDLHNLKTGNVYDLVKAINSGFVLNPSGKKEFADYNMLNWVAVRQPKRLLVHMGHNDGLYAIGGDAQPGQDQLELTALNYVALIDQIEGVTSKSQHLIFVLLPKISAVANLEVSGNGPDANGYWTKYRPVFSLSTSAFDSKTMAEQDRAVLSANSIIEERLEKLKSRRTISVVSAYNLFARLDYKNDRKQGEQIVIDRCVIDNRYIDAIGPVFVSGGMQSIDGMHPTNVGYCELALELIRLYKPDLNDKEINELRRNAFTSETLLTDPPIGLEPLVALLRFVRYVSRDPSGRPMQREHENVLMSVARLIEIVIGTVIAPARPPRSATDEDRGPG